MTAGDLEKADNTRVSAAYGLLVFVPVFLEIWWMKGQEKLHKRLFYRRIWGGGCARYVPTTRGPNSFNFMQFLRGNLAKLYVGAPWRLAPSPLGNPGSATAFLHARA